jgi:hypothetical protein
LESQEAKNKAQLISIGESSFEELRSSLGYIDKTKLILDFFKFPKNFCILRPRRMGKTKALQMIKRFYGIPKINLDHFDPQAPKPSPSGDIFKGTFIANPPKFDPHYKNADDFIKEHMGQYPVIYLDFKNMSFKNLHSIETEDVMKAMINQIIMPAFAEYDYLFFIEIAKKICSKKYGGYTKEKYQLLLNQHNLKDFKDTKDKIAHLLDIFHEELKDDLENKSDILTFQKCTKGRIDTMDELVSSLDFLMQKLKNLYEKEVILLVDEHDSTVAEIHSSMSLNNPEKNTELVKSIEVYSGVLCKIFKKIAKENPHMEKFLMFGISRGILDRDDSTFNTLEVNTVLDRKYSEYFGFSEDEISKIVDLGFKGISDEHKEVLKKNSKAWYNGYYFGGNKRLYATYSTASYLNK